MKNVSSRLFRPRFLLASVLVLGATVHLSPEAGAANLAYQKKLVRLHNEAREKRNKPPLRLRGALNLAAAKYAEVMAANNHFDHVGPSPELSTFDQRIEAECPGCFSTMAENIALGQQSEEDVTNGWIKSPGHRRNILNKKFRFVGFGKAGTSPHWVAKFGG